MREEFYGTLQDLLKHLEKTKKFDPPVCEDELKYFIGSLRQHTSCCWDFGVIGNYIVWNSKNKAKYLGEWLDKHKKQKHLTMLALILALGEGASQVKKSGNF